MGTTHERLVDDWSPTGTWLTPGGLPVESGPPHDTPSGPGDYAVRVYSVLASLALGLVGILGVHVLLDDPSDVSWAGPGTTSAPGGASVSGRP